MFNKLGPYKITFIFIILGILWIFLSDILAEQFFGPALYDEIQSFKGSIFVLLTAGLVFFLTNRLNEQLEKSQRAIKKNELQYHKLLNSAPVGIIVHQRGRIKFANEKILDVVGASNIKEVINSRIVSFVQRDYRRSLKDMEKALYRQQKMPVKEIKLLRLDGKIIEAELSSILIDYQGQRAIQSVLQDVTDRNMAEREVRESERKLKEAQRIGKMGNWEYLIGYEKTNWSEEMFVIFDRQINEGQPVLFTDVVNCFHPDDREKFRQSLLDAIHKGIPYDEDFRIVDRQKQIRYINDVGRVYRNQKGEVYKLEGIAQDITSRKKAELSLKESEARLKEAQRMGKTGHWEMNINTRELSWSEEVYRIYQQSMNATCPKMDDISKHIHPEDREMWRETVNKLIYESKGYNIVFRIRDKDGKICYLNEIAQPVTDEKGELVNIKGVVIDISERKRAELKQAESEKRYRKLVETIPDGVALLDKEGQYLFLNNAGANFLRGKPKQYIGKTVWEVHHNDIARFFMSIIHNVVRNKSNWQKEAQLGKRWYIINAEPLLPSDPEEEVTVLAVVTDITEQKRNQFQLEDIKSGLNNAQRLARMGSWSLDLERNTMYWSDMTYKILGLKAENTTPNLGLMLELVHPEDRMAVKQKFLQLKEGLVNSLEIEHRIITPAGQQLSLYQIGEATFNKNGKAVQIAGTLQDISERVQSEKALKKAFAQLENYTNALNKSTLVAITDLEGKILHINQKFCNVTHFKKEELLGKNFKVMSSGHHSREFFNHMFQTLKKGETWRGEIKNQTKEGQTFWIDMVINPIFNEEGEIERFLSISYEVTDRKENEEKLARSNRELETFLYKASHDLKGPLTTMNGLINIGKHESRHSQIQQLFTMLEERSGQLRKTLDELVEISNIRQSQLHLQPIDFDQILQNTLLKLEEQYQRNMLVIESEIYMHSEQYFGDQHLIKLLFLHMLDNSIKYRRKQHVRVKIQVQLLTDKLKIMIEDNAQGIPPSVREKVFEMYYRGDERSKGAGLGLYIVKTIVDRLNGDIFFTSKPGVGTNFAITIPLQQELKQAA
jgi:PAS domain S-box-containing protein